MPLKSQTGFSETFTRSWKPILKQSGRVGENNLPKRLTWKAHSAT